MRKPAGQTSSTTQCIVASDDILARKCAQALGQALGLGNAVGHQKLQHRGTTSLYFFVPPLIEAEIRGHNRPVLPLPDGRRWLHVAIDLNFIAARCWRINHVSIGVLQGDPSTLLKEQVLRAEWQIPEATDNSGHAQPHWHVLSAAGIVELPKFDEVVEATPGFEEFLGEPKPKATDGGAFGHFHYAMVTDWHRPSSTGPYQVLADESALVSWLGSCVRYICHQLTHVDRKAGS